MKSLFSLEKLILILTLYITVIAGCKKTETITIPMPTAKFTVQVIDPYMMSLTDGSTTSIDSNFYFRNSSDSGANITYHWDFGDGSTSTEKSGKHSYSKRGSYKVTLTVSNNNIAFDTLQQMISVILGQQQISLGDGIYASPVAIEETSMNEFLLLASTGFGNGFILFQLDSLLKRKSSYTFPPTYRFISMSPAGDGNYIFTGSTEGPEKGNELIKMKADGTLLWKKVLASNDTYTYATPTPDGGYMVIGSRPLTLGYGNSYTLVIKTDANGTAQWEKSFEQEQMMNADNAVVLQDGILVAGRNPGPGLETDSVFLVKLNHDGTIIWKNTVFAGMNRSLGSTRISKLENGDYAITSGSVRGIFLFSPSGDFLDRKLAPNEVADVIGSADGNLIALQTEPGNGSRIQVTNITLEGVQQWSAYPEGRQKLASGGWSCCASSWPVAIKPLRSGGTITTGYQVVDNGTGAGMHTEILLMELDTAGKLK
jgi:PKD repeat protein